MVLEKIETVKRKYKIPFTELAKILGIEGKIASVDDNWCDIDFEKNKGAEPDKLVIEMKTE